MNNRFVTLCCSTLLLVAFSSAVVEAQDSGWPRTLPLEDGNVTIYPLQVEDMNGDLIRFRAALAYQQAGSAEPVFGAGWFESRVEIDREKGIVHPIYLNVSNTRFPAGTNDVQAELTTVFAQQMPGWSLDFPVDELLTSLETAEQEAKTAQTINTSPPTIIYRDHPALLVNIDGEPVLRAIENSNYQAVINTPYPMIFDGRVYYLNAAKDVWYRADSADGPYRFVAQPPQDIAAMVEAAGQDEEGQVSAEKVTAANAPEIVVATTPTELIVTDGPATFVPLVDDLLVLDNSSDDLFMHIGSQQYYIVLAGRWYHSGSLNGPWTYQGADELPAAFANIPKTSEQADSRVYVAGTSEAQEAVLDAQIPQTAAVTRGPVDIEVQYDGDPIFELVDGTNMTYAYNTDSSVLQSNGLYYLVEDAVWYVSSSPNGPWEVSDYRPEEVAAISPQSPMYNVKYVYVYDSTPESVYVGYTPGYTGSYIYNDTIVYGTGWNYSPWVSPYYYYPRYSTWGFNVGYSPWYGWGFGLSWGWGPFYAGFYSGGYWHHHHYWHHPHHGYWGARGYRPRPGHHNRYANGRGGNDHGRYGRGDNRQDGRDRNGQGRNNIAQDASARGKSNSYARSDNLYRDGAQRAKMAENSQRAQKNRQASRTLASNKSAQDRTRPTKTGRNNAGPVSTSALRVKAQVRDAKSEVNQGKRVADSNRKGKQQAAGHFAPRQSGSWESASASNTVRRSATQPGNSSRRVSETATNRPGKQAPTAPQHRAVPRQSNRSANAPTTIASRNHSLQQQQANSRPVAQPRSAQAASAQRNAPQNRVPQQRVPQARVVQKTTPQTGAPPRGTQQRSAPRTSAPVRAPQRASAPSRNVAQGSAPPRNVKQTSAPPRNVTQPSAPSSRAQYASAPQRSAQNQKGGSNRGGRSNGSRQSSHARSGRR